AVSDDRRLVLFLSRLHPKKGVPLLLEAFAGLPSYRRSWTLVVAGGDERGHLTELRALASRLGVDNDVIWTGPLAGEAKRDAYAAAELFVLPSLDDNFGIVVAEALGAGVPVITTHATPWAELIEQDCGWHVPADVDGIRGALREAFARGPLE